jgi:hypothetical protein
MTLRFPSSGRDSITPTRVDVFATVKPFQHVLSPHRECPSDGADYSLVSLIASPVNAQRSGRLGTQLGAEFLSANPPRPRASPLAHYQKFEWFE